MQAAFEQALTSLVGALPSGRLGLAVSGGVDSMALAGLAATWARPRNIDLHAFIIDHNLRENSDLEQARVAENLHNLGISPHCLSIHLENDSQMELAARNERRRILSESCSKLNVGTLLQGHHLNDQYELFLIRAMKHSSWYGLAGMQPVSYLERVPAPNRMPIKIIRPLLKFQKKDLKEWCIAHSISWFEDHTNSDPTLTPRNAIRKLYNDHSIFLPASMSLASISEMQSTFAEQRNYVETRAREMLHIYFESKQLVLDEKLGKAELDTQVWSTLGPDIKTQVLVQLIEWVTPLKVASIGYKRRAIHDLAQSLHKCVLADVLVSPGHAKIELSRAPHRRRDGPSVYTATSSWSQWHLIDNRFWFRWKLPSDESAKDFFISVTKNPMAGQLIRERFPDAKLKTKNLHSQPFFSFDPDIHSSNIIGYPTLGSFTGLDVEYRYKSVFPQFQVLTE